MAERIPVGLVGVTGYTGMELTRVLAGHPGLELVRATSRSEAGKRLSSLYPFLAGPGDLGDMGALTITQPDPADLAASCKLVFLAVPHKTAQEIAAALIEKGVKVVDLSADFRLRDKATYEKWYATPHTQGPLLAEAVYGLPEIYRDKMKKARLIANPGCYPTSAILGLLPALEQGLVSSRDIVIDSKSGTSGAGRKAGVGTLFCEVSDTFRAYNLTKHRHTPEIEQEVSLLAGEDVALSFNTHLLPINRGILSTIYTKLAKPLTLAEAHAAYAARYANEPLVRVLPLGTLPETRFVRGTMFCDIGLAVDERIGRLIIVTSIDNLCRGASGQAVLGANLMLGLPEIQGLPLAPLMP
ncbi:MAG: N-acetyl-gamma-glutamyl-phosphate reductase [Desulfovibrio sp.]|jgi:N-acetyl-gamma-glutamyl-phosphate reductase|nr:N-acetyl-gamma-glutamyl-phosphate reductase [Desulfovibrio sp.]